MTLGTRMEQLWLRALPTLTRDYLWISVDGLRIYGSRRHHLMLYWLLKGKYERFTRMLFEAAVGPGMRVLDIGAHIGYYTLLAARGVGATGTVYSFESDPGNFRFLQHNVVLNGMDSIVTSVPKAVADRSGVRPFFADSANSLLSSLWNELPSDEPIAVECTTIDDFLDERRIDVVKIDVEGGELHALRGMRQALAASSQLVLFVECNPTALSAASSSVSALLDELSELELDVQLIDEKGRCLAPITAELLEPKLAESKWYANLYCTRADS